MRPDNHSVTSAGDIEGTVGVTVKPRDLSWAATGVVAVAGVGLTALYAIATSRLFLADYFPDAGVSLDWIKILVPRGEDPVASYVVLTLTASALYAVALITVARWGGSVPRNPMHASRPTPSSFISRGPICPLKSNPSPHPINF